MSAMCALSNFRTKSVDMRVESQGVGSAVDSVWDFLRAEVEVIPRHMET